jgi:hypothetical protein
VFFFAGTHRASRDGPHVCARHDDQTKISSRRELGHGQQEGTVIEGFETVSGVGNGDEVSGCALPGGGPGDEAEASVKDVHGGLTGVLVFGQPLSGEQDDQGLAQNVLVASVDRVRAASGGCRAGEGEVLTYERGE